jgi:DNA-binding GntR family transcriptional regulator
LRFHYLKNVFGLRIKDAQQEHKQIVEALRTRDADKAEALARQHNQNALASYIDYLRAIGELSPDTEDVYV